MTGMAKRAVNLSLGSETVDRAKQLGINMSEVAEAAIAAEVGRRDWRALQQRIDSEMEYWNEFGASGLTVADEFGNL